MSDSDYNFEIYEFEELILHRGSDAVRTGRVGAEDCTVICDGEITDCKIIKDDEIFLECAYKMGDRTVRIRRKLMPFKQTSVEGMKEGAIDLKNTYFEREDIVTLRSMVSKTNEIDFSLSFFDDCNFGRVEIKATFRHAIFGGDVDFKKSSFLGNTSFDGSTFLGNATFREADFDGTAMFEKAVFQGPLCFARVLFSANAYFSSAQFFGIADFSECAFKEYTLFSGAHFHENADLRISKFFKTVRFKETVFSAEADFSECAFEGYVVFDGSQFHKNVSFKLCRFREGAQINISFAERMLFRKAYFEGDVDISGKMNMLSLRDSMVLGIVRIDAKPKDEGSMPTALDICGLRLAGGLKIDWNKHGLPDAVYLSNAVYEGEQYSDLGTAIGSKQIKQGVRKHTVKRAVISKVDRDEIYDQFLVLREAYRKNHDHPQEKEAYKEYMRVKGNVGFHKSDEGRGLLKVGHKAANLIGRGVYGILDGLGGFGTNPRRLFILIVLVPMILGILYSVVFDTFSLLGSIQSSYVAFITMGLGSDSNIDDPLRTLLIIEGVFGAFMMIYLAFALAKQ